MPSKRTKYSLRERNYHKFPGELRPRHAHKLCSAMAVNIRLTIKNPGYGSDVTFINNCGRLPTFYSEIGLTCKIVTFNIVFIGVFDLNHFFSAKITDGEKRSGLSKEI